jgi:hypothetical protein
MAAGLGFKTFNTGDVLSAADVNGYLMQGILVFASAAARDAAITSPEEGQFAFLKDTNVTTYYTGSAWANVDTTGMTNPMTTTGDVIYSSSGSTPARLGIGTAGQVLQVNSGATAPEWATTAGGGSGLTLIKTATFTTSSGSSTTFDSVISSTYNDYLVIFHDISLSAADASLYFQYRKAAATKNGTVYYSTFYGYSAGTTTAQNWTDSAATQHTVMKGGPGGDGYSSTELTIFNGSYPRIMGSSYNAYRNWEMQGGGLGYLNDTIDGFIITPSTGTFSGSVIIYGLAKS